MRLGWKSSFVLVLVLLPACDRRPPDSSVAPTLSDSAGVRLIEYHGPLLARVVVPSLEWRHGFGEEDYPFQFANMAALDADGAVLVGDRGNRDIVRIEPGGRSFEVVARGGQGPAEIATPVAVVADPSGGVWVDDMGNGKLLLFEAGSLTRTIDTSPNYEVAYGAMVVGVAPSGSLLMTTASWSPDFREPWLDGHMTRMDLGGLALDSVATFPMMPRQPSEGVNPFTGEGRATGAGGGWVQTRTDLPEVRWRDSDGRIVQVVRWQPDPVYPTQATWEEYMGFLRENLTRVNPGAGPDQIEMIMASHRERYSLDTSAPLPLFREPLGTSSGDVWLPAFVMARHGRDHVVVSADGMRVVSVRFDRPVHVLDASAGAVLVNELNEMDVQAIALYSVELGW